MLLDGLTPEDLGFDPARFPSYRSIQTDGVDLRAGRDVRVSPVPSWWNANRIWQVFDGGDSGGTVWR